MVKDLLECSIGKIISEKINVIKIQEILIFILLPVKIFFRRKNILTSNQGLILQRMNRIILNFIG